MYVLRVIIVMEANRPLLLAHQCRRTGVKSYGFIDQMRRRELTNSREAV